MFNNIRYFIKEAGINLFRNRLMTLASILTVSSSTLILIIFFILASNINYILSNFENSIGMTVYVSEELSSEENLKFYDKLLEIETISEIVYVSKKEAFEKASDIFKGNDNVLKGLESDHPFPRSYEITLTSSEYGEDVYKILKEYEGEELSSIKYAQSETSALIIINGVIQLISIILIGGLSFIAIVIIMNTITMAVNSRKNEINIMKYVGATNSFVRWPFLLEGIFIGIVGSVVPLISSFLVYNEILDLIYKKLPMIEYGSFFQPVEDVFEILLPSGLMLGFLLGIVGSATSIKKHLNV